MKPRILILMHYMELGGAESAFLGLLQGIDPSRVDIRFTEERTLFCIPIR
ncbi:MAG: hypothetical protein GXY64_00245 [Bacteroidales bacterium]|nr:hypothetical protein [Bacteroidales bacterium]